MISALKRVAGQLLASLMLLGVFWLWPGPVAAFGPVVLYVLLMAAVASIPVGRFLRYRRGDLTRGQAWGGTVWELLQLLITIVAAAYIGKSIGTAVRGLAEPRWPMAASGLGLLALLPASLGAANVIRWGMGRVGKRLRLQ
jgi:hypothetical protein